VKTTLNLRAASLATLVLSFSACGGGGGGNNVIEPPPPPSVLRITTASLADGVVGVSYSQTLAVTGGTGARTFSTSAGTLPPGLALSATTGVISGTPAGAPGISNFTISVADSASPAQNDSQALSIQVSMAASGRNDSITTATPLPGNGTYSASISPSGDPHGTLDPDEDYYRIATTATSTITIDINAQVLGSPLDAVIEVLDAGGNVLNQCVSPAFSSECISDDEVLGIDRDSLLQLRVNGAGAFYIHVLDWGSNARPDLVYDLVISGVN
jgi:hypothetical protein